MDHSLTIVIWNANGLYQHALEIEQFLIDNSIDVMLISETHFTSKHLMTIPGYSLLNTNHPDGTGHGGSAIIIKKYATL